MAWTYDTSSGQYVQNPDDPATVAPTTSAPTATPEASQSQGTSYNIGSGTYNVSNVNLSDPNQIMAAGLTAAQTTTQPYQPLVTGYPSPLGDSVNNDLTNTLYNGA